MSSTYRSEPPLDGLDAAGVLAAAGTALVERRAAQVRDLQVVLAWADLHGEDPQAVPGAVPVRFGGDRLVRLGGDGTPLVAELCVHELAIARQTHPAATRATLADALDLRHRLPATWTLVQALDCEPWVATKIARLTRDLDPDQARLVDTAVAAALPGMAPGRVLALAEARVVEADPEAHAARIAEHARRRGVWAGPTRTDPTDPTGVGTRTLHARLDPGDVTWVDAVLERIVAAFHARPDILRAHHPDLPAELDDLTHHQLRALALGWLARPHDVLDLFAAAAEPAARREVPRRPDRTGQHAVIYLHLSDAALTGTGVGRVEGLGPMLMEQVTRLVGHAQVTINPVLDLDDHTRVDGYEHPTAVTVRTRLRCGGDVFPHTTSTATMTGRYDDDHPVPYDPGGPPGQTGDHNNAPLTRTNHRAKTHLGYQLRQLDDATYLWTTPHGLHRLVDPDGTHPLDPDDAWRITHTDIVHAALAHLASPA